MRVYSPSLLVFEADEEVFEIKCLLQISWQQFFQHFNVNITDYIYIQSYIFSFVFVAFKESIDDHIVQVSTTYGQKIRRIITLFDSCLQFKILSWPWSIWTINVGHLGRQLFFYDLRVLDYVVNYLFVIHVSKFILIHFEVKIC